MTWFVRQVWFHWFGEPAVLVMKLEGGGHEYKKARIRDIWCNRPGTTLSKRMQERKNLWVGR